MVRMVMWFQQSLAILMLISHQTRDQDKQLQKEFLVQKLCNIYRSDVDSF